MRATELSETPEVELAKKLPSLAKHDYNTIDKLMQKIAKRHQITGKRLHDKFVKKFKKTPDAWIKNKLDEVTQSNDIDVKHEVIKFANWVNKYLNIEHMPTMELSYDDDEAQQEHHTGAHTQQDNHVWVYVKNRNLVDILRTVVHELTHVRQGELGMIKPGDSYPGSPIELLADMVAGKLIKLYGKQNRYIFQ